MAQVPAYLLNQQGLLNRLGRTEQGLASLLSKPSAAPTVPTLEEEFGDRRETYRGILGDPAEQKNQTQAQMLFDIANTALAFSTAGSRPGMSPAERLAEAAVETKLFPTIAARTAAQNEQQQKFDLAALESAETSLTAKQKYAADLRKTLAGQKPEYMRVNFSDGSQKVFNVNTEMGARSFRMATEQPGAKAFKVGPEPTPAKPSAAAFKVVVDKDGKQMGQFDLSVSSEKKAMQDMLNANPSYQLAGIPTAPQIERPLGDKDYFDKFGVTKSKFESLPQDTQDILMGIPTITNRDYFTKFGMDKAQFLGMDPNDRNFLIGLPVLTDKDYFKKFGLTKAKFEGLEQEDRDVLLGLPTLTDENYFTKFGMDKASFLALDQDVKNRILDITPKPVIQKDARGRLVDVTNIDAPQIIWDVETTTRPKLQTITIDGIPQTVDITTSEGMARVDLANQVNQQQPGRASITNVTSSPKPKSFVVSNPDGSSQFVTSYDNGQTFTDTSGQIQSMPAGAYPVSDTTANEVAKGIRASAKAGEKLTELDANIAAQLGLNPEEFTQEDITAVKSALEMAREGTGVYSNFVATLDGISALIPFEGARDFVAKFTKDNQAARQYLRGVMTLGRSALVVNPRFPVAEMQKVEQLFVRPETFFTNPSTEANKFIELKSLAIAQYRRNLQQLEQGVPKAQREQIEANNFELQRLMSLLPGVPLPGAVGGAQDDLVDEASGVLFPQ
tara:strand:- start:2827 stop:5016 length:2190 start_codon:yes stop_codon:yes gene_type:complete